MPHPNGDNVRVHLALLGAFVFYFCFSNAKKKEGKFSSLLQVLETAMNFMKWMELFAILINVAAEFDQPS